MEIPTKKHGHKFLLSIGYLTILVGLLLFFILPLILLKIARLYDYPMSFLNDNVMLRFFLLLNCWFFYWVRASNYWKKWALKNVKLEEFQALNAKINDKDRSFVIKPFRDLPPRNKRIRATLFLLFLTIVITFDVYKKHIDRKLRRNPDYTYAVIQNVETEARIRKLLVKVAYAYHANGTLYKDTLTLKSGFLVPSREKNGFSIAKNDSFLLTYYQIDPTIKRIDFMQPSVTTLTKYKKIAKEKVQKAFPNHFDIDCIINNVYTNFGVNGIATLANFDKNYWDNEYFNKYKFKIFTKKNKVKSSIKSCDSQ